MFRDKKEASESAFHLFLVSDNPSNKAASAAEGVSVNPEMFIANRLGVLKQSGQEVTNSWWKIKMAETNTPDSARPRL